MTSWRCTVDRAIIWVDRTSSRCGVCNKNAFPDEATHEDLGGYHPADQKGCGVRWTHIGASCAYPGINERLAQMRPDLELIEGFGIR